MDTGYDEKRKKELDLSGHSVACTTGVLAARGSFLEDSNSTEYRSSHTHQRIYFLTIRILLTYFRLRPPLGAYIHDQKYSSASLIWKARVTFQTLSALEAVELRLRAYLYRRASAFFGWASKGLRSMVRRAS